MCYKSGRLCPVVLFLLNFCLISVHSASLGEVTGTGADGRDFSYHYVGDVLQLNCTLHPSVSWEAEDLFFTLENDLCDDQCTMAQDEMYDINNRTRQLNRQITGAQDAGEYICWLRTSQTIRIVDSQNVRVQYRPHQVKNINCEVYNWDESLTCRWENDVRYINSSLMDGTASSDLSVDVAIWPSQNDKISCLEPVSAFNEAPMCVWAGDRYRGAAFYYLVVTIRNTVTKDVNETFHRVTTHDIVKPAAPSLIWAAEKNSTCVTLAWTHARTVRSKQFRVKSSSGAELVVQSSRAVLCGLVPHSTYTFSVECQAKDHEGQPYGFWSNASSVNITTAEAEPGSSFEVHNGSYVLHECRNGKRNITVLLKAVPPEQQNGEIIGYQLVYSGTNMTVDKRSPTSAVVPNVPCDTDLVVRIFSRTSVGPSKTNAEIILSSDEKAPVLNFAVEDLGSRVRAVWDSVSDDRSLSPVSNIMLNTSTQAEDGTADAGDNATVFWCLGDRGECKEEVEWRSIPFTAGEIELPQQFIQPGPHNFLFGISRHGRAITWTSCIFNRQAPIDAPEEVEVNQVQQQLEVRWDRQKCSDEYPVHVTGYKINICQTQDCQATGQTIDIKGWERNRHKVSDLSQDVKYNITVQAVTSQGRLGKSSQPITKYIGLENATDHRSAIIGSVVAIVLFAIIIFVGYGWYRMYSNFQSKKRRFGSMDWSDFRPNVSASQRRGNYSDLPSSPSHAVQELSPSNLDSAMYDTEEETVSRSLETTAKVSNSGGRMEEVASSPVGGADVESFSPHSPVAIPGKQALSEPHHPQSTPAIDMTHFSHPEDASNNCMADDAGASMVVAPSSSQNDQPEVSRSQWDHAAGTSEYFMCASAGPSVMGEVVRAENSDCVQKPDVVVPQSLAAPPTRDVTHIDICPYMRLSESPPSAVGADDSSWMQNESVVLGMADSDITDKETEDVLDRVDVPLPDTLHEVPDTDQPVEPAASSASEEAESQVSVPAYCSLTVEV